MRSIPAGLLVASPLTLLAALALLAALVFPAAVILVLIVAWPRALLVAASFLLPAAAAARPAPFRPVPPTAVSADSLIRDGETVVAGC